MEYIREGDGSGEEEVSSPTAAKLGDHKEECEEATGPEGDGVKRRANSQMYWLKVTGGKQKLYLLFTIVSQRRRSFLHLYWYFRWCMSSF